MYLGTYMHIVYCKGSKNAFKNYYKPGEFANKYPEFIYYSSLVSTDCIKCKMHIIISALSDIFPSNIYFPHKPKRSFFFFTGLNSR